MISPYHPELYTWLRVVKIRLAQVVNFRLSFREGIEINKDAVELLKKSYPEMARKIIIHNQAIEDVIKGFKDDAFDVVFTMAILQHIHPKSEWIFSEIVRITKSFLIIREAEGYISWRHFPRNYKKIFERLGMKQIEAYNSERIFKKV
jgi:SAM-dependent methyltransferase